MTTNAVHERRLLILAPTGRDAELTRAVLGEAGLRSTACDNLGHLVSELQQGAGAVLLSEEAIATDVELHYLGDWLLGQEPWSDLPILLLARYGADSTAVRRAVRALGNVTVVERPVRVAAMVTAAQTALRARQRQYDAREQMRTLDKVAQELAESRARFQALFTNAAVGIAELEADGRLAMVNDALCSILDTARESLVGTPLFDHTHAEDRADLVRMHAALPEGRDSFAVERRFVRRDGEVRWVKLSVARGVAVIEDVTERHNAEEELREADRRKDEFLATLAHELRNPLAPIRNSLHIVRMAGAQNPTVERVAGMIERQVGSMVRIVDDLMEISRVSRGKIELRKESVELAAVLRNAVDTSMPLIEAGRHVFGLDMPDEPLLLQGDPVRLSQVFSNLLNNAAKYTPPGGRIQLRVGVEQGNAVICVEDNGDGIPPEMLKRVFNMFTQLGGRERSQGGLGIGLTLARALVEMHGGAIEAASDGPGKGCRFTVRLPLAVEAGTAQAPVEETIHSLDIRARRVLVVDDNQDAADSLGMLLQLLGAEVLVVHDGRAALEALDSFRPGVVVLDLGMPGMSGLEVARRMREDPAHRAITLVALTGWGQRDDRRRTREAGFDYHLVKPADLTVLRRILARRGSREEERATRH